MTLEQRLVEFFTAPVVRHPWAALEVPFIGGFALMAFVLGVATTFPLAIPCVVAGIGFTVLALRSARAGIVCYEKGVRVRNVLRTSAFFDWDEIDGCVEGDYLGRTVGVLLLRDGRRIPVTMLPFPPFPFRPLSRVARERVDEFNELVRGKQAATAADR